MRRKYLHVHELVGQRGKGAYYWYNKIHCMCSCSTSLSPVNSKSLKACLRKAGVPAKSFCVHACTCFVVECHVYRTYIHCFHQYNGFCEIKPPMPTSVRSCQARIAKSIQRKLRRQLSVKLRCYRVVVQRQMHVFCTVCTIYFKGC